jgi:hypothetical protein
MSSDCEANPQRRQRATSLGQSRLHVHPVTSVRRFRRSVLDWHLKRDLTRRLGQVGKRWLAAWRATGKALAKPERNRRHLGVPSRSNVAIRDGAFWEARNIVFS